MKKVLLLSFVFTCIIGKANILPDSVIMTVAEKPIPVAEFQFIASKNQQVDFSNEKSVDEYLELFKNFKLKVAEAESLGLDKTSSFKSELDTYQSQLKASFLSDKQGEEEAALKIYDRTKVVPEISQIYFPLYGNTISKDTVEFYREVMTVYNRLRNGEDFDAVGEELAQKHQHEGENIEEQDGLQVEYKYIRTFFPLQNLKEFDNVVYSTPVGEFSHPFRTAQGYHIVKVHNKIPNPGIVQIAHILLALPEGASEVKEEEVRLKAADIYKRAVNGEDFTSLAREFSEDGNAEAGGIIPPFGIGEIMQPVEEMAFALENVGDISQPLRTSYGYHIIKLIDKGDIRSFEEEKNQIIRHMARGEWNFELYEAYDERMKKEYGYIFYPEAYAELQRLCDDYFPTSNEFYEKSQELKSPLIHLSGMDFPQNEFAHYMKQNPFSVKTYAGDFMQEVFSLFVRDIIVTLERQNLETKYPELKHLMQEYRDGMLLFEISNRKIWQSPIEEQAELEKKWLEELNSKYPVVINWDAVKKLRNHK